MFSRFLPKEEIFFEMFNKQAGYAVSAITYFNEIAQQGGFNDEAALKMHQIEHACDELTHEIMKRLNQTFITPFDREDIHSLAHELDSVVDIIFSITNRMRLYRLTEPNPELIQFGELAAKSISTLGLAINALHNFKHPQVILDACVEINRLENMGDLLRDGIIGRLLNADDGMDAILVIKWKEIYELAETLLDKCEDVANVVESILIKQG